MPRYLVERELGDVDDETLRRAADESTRVREERFPEIAYEHTHVVRTPDGLRAYCVYAAPGPEAIREHAHAAGLTVDAIQEIHADLL